MVVVGSGAAGMTAALTAAHHGLRVVVLEKTGAFGGSTARSGGGIWVPGNEVLRRAGVRDTPEQARAYLAHVAGDERAGGPPAGAAGARPGHARAGARAWPRWTSPGCPATRTTIPRPPAGWPPGAASSRGRWTARVLGAELAHLNPPYLPAPPGVTITQADYRWLSLGPRHPRAMLAAAKVAGRLARTRLLRQRTLSMGQALAAGLRAGLAAEQVPVWLDTPMTGLRRCDGRPGHRGAGDPRRPARADPARAAA